MYDITDFPFTEVSVAMTESMATIFGQHLDRGPEQEDLTFFYWRPSVGHVRFTAVVTALALPTEDDRVLEGNVSFTGSYFTRILNSVPDGCGIGLAHSHLGPGWQGMSEDDIVAERDRLASAVAGRTQLPVLGLTRGTDGSWSGRVWLRAGRRQYERFDAVNVRVVGASGLAMTFHPGLRPQPAPQETQKATLSVWGSNAQADLARARVGTVGLGSVGSVVAEGLARTGVEQPVFIDHDRIELRNLDRTLGAVAADAVTGTYKVDVATRTAMASATASSFTPRPVPRSLLSKDGLAAALDCDAIVCCVDRPWPRFVLNVLSNAHLIPVIDGGILARINDRGLPLHIDWRIHTVGPERACLHCIKALLRSDVSLDREGKLDDPDYIASLNPADRERYARRNVFAFSLSVAAHELLQLVGLVSRMPRVGGIGPQHYQAYPGAMAVRETSVCAPDCDIAPLTASATDLAALL